MQPIGIKYHPIPFVLKLLRPKNKRRLDVPIPRTSSEIRVCFVFARNELFAGMLVCPSGRSIIDLHYITAVNLCKHGMLLLFRRHFSENKFPIGAIVILGGLDYVKTALHRKLLKMCKVSSREPRHWLLEKSGRSIFVPELGKVLAVKRVMYAAFIGPIPRDMDVSLTCKLKWCASPYHMTLVPSRNHAAPLSLPNEIEARHKPEMYFNADKPNLLPSGVSIKIVESVKMMCRDGLHLREISNSVGLPIDTVMKIRNGKFDVAVKAVGQRKHSSERILKGRSIDSLVSRPVWPERLRSSSPETSVVETVETAAVKQAPSRPSPVLEIPRTSVSEVDDSLFLPPGVKMSTIVDPADFFKKAGKVPPTATESGSHTVVVRPVSGVEIDFSIPTYVPVRTREELDMTEEERAWLQNMMVQTK